MLTHCNVDTEIHYTCPEIRSYCFVPRVAAFIFVEENIIVIHILYVHKKCCRRSWKIHMGHSYSFFFGFWIPITSILIIWSKLRPTNLIIVNRFVYKIYVGSITFFSFITNIYLWFWFFKYNNILKIVYYWNYF